MTDQVLDKETWPLEAEAALKDVRGHVREASVAEDYKSTNRRIYLRITTYEGEVLIVEMSADGFRVAAPPNSGTISDTKYETLYALLDSVSNRYRQSFGEELTTKLRDLEKKRQG
ncbi:unnamed protein product, partial [Iphiclides podalirius]